MANLNDFLLSDIMTLGEIQDIESGDSKRDIQQRGIKMFVEEYKRIIQEIMKDENKYEFKSLLVKRSVNEIEILLGV